MTLDERLTLTLRALADPNRRRLILALRQREECVSALAEDLGVTTALVSHHLGVLQAAGFVRERHHGSWHCYSLVVEQLAWFSTELDMLVDPVLPAEASCCANPCNGGR